MLLQGQALVDNKIFSQVVSSIDPSFMGVYNIVRSLHIHMGNEPAYVHVTLLLALLTISSLASKKV